MFPIFMIVRLFYILLRQAGNIVFYFGYIVQTSHNNFAILTVYETELLKYTMGKETNCFLLNHPEICVCHFNADSIMGKHGAFFVRIS